ncbi:MAG: recombinase family protein [Lachnospiraceae bacterium]|nr:recombinase family protein [Lachnospiraceae bacterium]
MRVYGYLKVDYEECVLGTQRGILNRYVDLNFIDIEKIVEEVVSGSVKAESRPKFMSLLEGLEEGDILIITEFSRLGRYKQDCIHTFLKLKELGVRLCILNKPFFNDWLLLQNNRLYEVVSELFMQEENDMALLQRRLLSGSTLTGMQKAVENGKKIGRPATLLPPKSFCDNYREYKQGALMGFTLKQFCEYCKISKSGYYKWVRLIETHEEQIRAKSEGVV